jgi:hypothetical protein
LKIDEYWALEDLNQLLRALTVGALRR